MDTSIVYKYETTENYQRIIPSIRSPVFIDKATICFQTLDCMIHVAKPINEDLNGPPLLKILSSTYCSEGISSHLQRTDTHAICFKTCTGRLKLYGIHQSLMTDISDFENDAVIFFTVYRGKYVFYLTSKAFFGLYSCEMGKTLIFSKLMSIHEPNGENGQNGGRNLSSKYNQSLIRESAR